MALVTLSEQSVQSRNSIRDKKIKQLEFHMLIEKNFLIVVVVVGSVASNSWLASLPQKKGAQHGRVRLNTHTHTKTKVYKVALRILWVILVVVSARSQISASIKYWRRNKKERSLQPHTTNRPFSIEHLLTIEVVVVLSRAASGSFQACCCYIAFDSAKEKRREHFNYY